uniref:Uncharacterized protein n=1 Tax=Arundo donax TaxID=35708 RepID=A0A0A9FXS8_ARUDO
MPLSSGPWMMGSRHLLACLMHTDVWVRQPVLLSVRWHETFAYVQMLSAICLMILHCLLMRFQPQNCWWHFLMDTSKVARHL